MIYAEKLNRHFFSVFDDWAPSLLYETRFAFWAAKWNFKFLHQRQIQDQGSTVDNLRNLPNTEKQILVIQIPKIRTATLPITRLSAVSLGF